MPQSFTADSTQRQPTPTSATLESTEEGLSDEVPAHPSPEIEPPNRAPTIPHTLPPLEALEPVNFSITMNRNTFGEGSELEAGARNSGQWHWDIQF